MASRYEKAKMYAAEKLGPGTKGGLSRVRRGAALLGALITGKETKASKKEIQEKWKSPGKPTRPKAKRRGVTPRAVGRVIGESVTPRMTKKLQEVRGKAEEGAEAAEEARRAPKKGGPKGRGGISREAYEKYFKGKKGDR